MTQPGTTQDDPATRCRAHWGGPRAGAPAGRRSVSLTRTRTGRTRLFGYLLLTPALLYIFALIAVPFFLAVRYSVSDVSVTKLEGTFVGLKNFRDLWGDPAFRIALQNTFVYTFISIALNAILGTFLAFILLEHFPGKRLVRFLLLLPFTIPIALTILSWRWMFDSQYSVINWLGKNTHFYALLNWVAAHTPLTFLQIPPYGVQWLRPPWGAVGAGIPVHG